MKKINNNVNFGYGFFGSGWLIKKVVN